MKGLLKKAPSLLFSGSVCIIKICVWPSFRVFAFSINSIIDIHFHFILHIHIYVSEKYLYIYFIYLVTVLNYNKFLKKVKDICPKILLIVYKKILGCKMLTVVSFKTVTKLSVIKIIPGPWLITLSEAFFTKSYPFLFCTFNLVSLLSSFHQVIIF